jgi:hypothetical protein
MATTLLNEAFVGSDGSAWSSSNWDAGTGTATIDILSNAGRITTASSSPATKKS